MSNAVSNAETLVICEGLTEVCYLRELVAFLGVESQIRIRHSSIQNPFDAIGNVAQERHWATACGRPFASEIWFVFDRDTHNSYLQAAKIAQELGFHPVFSRPCIEFWFLCHFPEAPKNLAPDTQLFCESRITVTNDDEGFVTKHTVDYFLPVTSPVLCFEELKKWAPWYTKTNQCFLEHLAVGTRLAYEQSKASAANWKVNGSAMPLLIDRLCALAEINPTELFDALEKEAASDTPNFKRIVLQRGSFFVNKANVLKALDLLIDRNEKLTEDEYIYCTNALLDLSTAVKNALVNGHSLVAKKDLLEKLTKIENTSESIAVVDGAGMLKTHFNQPEEAIERLPISTLTELFKIAQQTLVLLKNRVNKVTKSRKDCTKYSQ